MRAAENTEDILVLYEQEAEEWALYLKSLFGHIVSEGGILLYNLETSSFKHQELDYLPCYKCKVLILSCGLLNCLNPKRSYFLERVLKPANQVVILLCGVENSELLYDLLTLDGGSQEISTDQEPEEYLSVVSGIIQTDHKPGSDVNLPDVRGASGKTDLSFKTEVFSETLETNKQSILVLPGRISCENPGEIFILLRNEIDDETLEIEFVANNQQTRLQPASWNKRVKYVKALDFPAGPVYVNVYCGGVIKTTARIEYYTALEEIEHIFKKVADPIAFTCQAFKFSSVEKLDNVMTLLLKSKIPAYEFSPFQSEEKQHQQASSHLEEFPTLLHCAARFGLKNLATFLLSCPEATWACEITNKYGDDPASMAEKHGHRELRKLIGESSIFNTVPDTPAPNSQLLLSRKKSTDSKPPSCSERPLTLFHTPQGNEKQENRNSIINSSLESVISSNANSLLNSTSAAQPSLTSSDLELEVIKPTRPNSLPQNPSPTSPLSPSWPMFSAPSSPMPTSSTSSDSSPISSPLRKARALYACKAEHDSELSFTAGTIFDNVHPSQEPGWLEGTLNGKTGLIPENYVEFL